MLEIKIKKVATDYDLSCILSNATYGIVYWADSICIKSYGDMNPEDLKGMCVEDKFVKVLNANGTIEITTDAEDDYQKHTMNLSQLKNGIIQTLENDPTLLKYELCDLDAGQCDNVIQYAIFDDLIFG